MGITASRANSTMLRNFKELISYTDMKSDVEDV